LKRHALYLFLKCILVTVLLSLPVSTVNGQSNVGNSSEKHPHQYSIMEWSRDDGLASNHVYDIIQSRDGFLWIGTGGGLSRFDGNSFTNINRSSHPVLLSNIVNSLLEDRNGNIWFGTHGGGLYTITPDSLIRITDKQGLPSDYVLSLAEDSTGTIWVGTDGEGLGKVLPDTVLKYSVNEGLDRHIHSLAVDQNNTLWIGGRTGLFVRRNGFFSAFEAEQPLPSPSILSLHITEDGLLAGTPTGIGRIQEGSVELFDEIDQPIYARSVAKDEKGSIWISTLGNGAYKISNGVSMNYIHADEARGTNVNKVFIDREENIWLGTTGYGIIRLRDEIITTYTKKDGLPDDLILSVTEGKKGDIWAGTPQGIARFTNNNFTTFVPGTLPDDRFIFSVHIDRNETVWASTRNGKLYRIINEQISKFPHPFFQGMSIYVVNSSKDGALWTGSNRGAFRYKDDEFERFTTEDGDLTNDDVRSITQDEKGTVWIGTSLGLNAYSEGDFTSYGNEEGFSDLLVISLYADGDDDVWAGTFGGLHRVRDGRVSAITQGDGLPQDQISTILEDELGYLWLGTAGGILRIRKSMLNDFLDKKSTELFFDEFGTADGMKNELVTGTLQPTGLKARDGTLWFATDYGVATLNPAEVKKNRVPPPVHLVSTRIDRSDSKPFRVVQPLSLSRNHNEIEISYAAPSFIKPMDLTFRYMLEGLHNEWIDAGSRRSAYFSRIPPGEYTFRVIAANENGVWNEAGVALPIVVHPPFWLTWWFISFVVIAFLTSGPAIYYRRVTSLKKKQLQQQNFTGRLIESQESERNRIAGELHDSLGQNLIIIKNRAQMARQNKIDKEYIDAQLEEISSTASSTIQEIRKISHNLRPYNLQRFGFTNSVSRLVKNAEESSGITFTKNLEDVDKMISPEHETHFFRIIQESLNNILKHSEATHASITLRITNGSVRFIIRDEGKGFDLNDELRQKGFGLEDIEQRADLIGGKLKIRSMPGRGTEIHLGIPISEATS